MRARLVSLIAAAIMLPAVAWGQYQGNIPPGSVLGNPQTTPRPAAPSSMDSMGIVSSVPTNAALKALPTTRQSAVVRQSFTAAGDTPPMAYYASGTACSLNAGAGDNGSQVRSADGKCWIWVPPASGVTPMAFGCAGNGAADDTACVQAAVNASQGKTLLTGNRIYKLTSTVTSAGQILIRGEGGGQGAYSTTCLSGFRQGVANINLISLPGAGSIFRDTCIDAVGVTNTGGIAISIPAGSNKTAVLDTQINGACIGVDMTGSPSVQLADASVRNGTFLPAVGTACRAIRVGNSSSAANTVDNTLGNNQIYCGPDDGGQVNRGIGVEIKDSGGLTMDNDPPYGCRIGTLIAPGSGQYSNWGHFTKGLGDTSYTADFMIDALTGSAIFGNQFTGTWAASARNGASVVIKSSGGASLSGTSFVGHRTGPGGNNNGFEVTAGARFSLRSSWICPGPTNSTGAGVVLGGDAYGSVVQDNLIGFCAAFTGSLATGIRITTSANDVGQITGNELGYLTGEPIVWGPGPPAGASAIIKGNRGLDTISGSVAIASAITLPMRGLVQLTGSGSITSMTPTWGTREIFLVPTGAAGVTFAGGGTAGSSFCGGATIPQFGMAIARYEGGFNCWLVK